MLTVRRARAGAVLLVLLLMAVCPLAGIGARTACASPMDYQLTAHGGDTPFSLRVEDWGTPWDLYRNRITSPPVEGYRFAEQIGNQDLGQVLYWTDNQQRVRRIVIDFMAAQESPQVLYLDPGPLLDHFWFTPGDREAVLRDWIPSEGAIEGQGLPRVTHDAPPVTVVPEPAAPAAIVAAALLLRPRRRRRFVQP